MIPKSLLDQVESFLEKVPFKTQKTIYDRISKRYRTGQDRALQSKEEAIIYSIARLPATYAVGQNVLDSLKGLYPLENLKTFLDLGAGVGPSRWLIEEALPSIKTLTLLERNSHMYEVGNLLKHPLGSFILADYQTTKALSPHDVTFLSYTLSEIPKNERNLVLSKFWSLTNQVIILIEPGTPEGFQVIKEARSHLIERGGFVLAPCGHEATCPMSSQDWCHFSCRLDRSKAHQYIKNGIRSFEDEKFSYLIVTKEKAPKHLPQRIIRPPLHPKGQTVLDLCTSQGIKRLTLTSAKDPLYKQHRHLLWGETFNDAPLEK